MELLFSFIVVKVLNNNILVFKSQNMKKTLFTIFLTALMTGVPLFGQTGKAPNLLESSIQKELTNKGTENFPTTEWIDFTDVSWYNSTSTSFTLSNAEQLAGLAKLVYDGNDFSGKTIILSNDIDVGKHLWTSIGYSYQKPFSGIFLGNNHTIKNVFINRPTGDFVGFFGQAFKASLKDLKLDNVIIRAKGTAGCFVGNLSTNSSAENCHVTNGEIIGTDYNVGGFAGSLLTESFATNSSFEGYVEGINQIGGFTGSLWDKATVRKSFAKGTVKGEYIIGGFVGFTTMAFGPNRTNVVKDSYCITDVEANIERAGGFVGYAQFALNVENSYAVGNVASPIAVGSFAGMVGNAEFKNAHFDKTVSTIDAVGVLEMEGMLVDITGNITSVMKNKTFAEILNASNSDKPWRIVNGLNDNYPVLNFQNLGIQEYTSKELNLKIYPTITEKLLHIQSNAKVLDYKIYDINGRIIPINNKKMKEIDVSSFTKGVYIISVSTIEGTKNLKFVKK